MVLIFKDSSITRRSLSRRSNPTLVFWNRLGSGWRHSYDVEDCAHSCHCRNTSDLHDTTTHNCTYHHSADSSHDSASHVSGHATPAEHVGRPSDRDCRRPHPPVPARAKRTPRATTARKTSRQYLPYKFPSYLHWYWYGRNDDASRNTLLQADGLRLRYCDIETVFISRFKQYLPSVS